MGQLSEELHEELEKLEEELCSTKLWQTMKLDLGKATKSLYSSKTEMKLKLLKKMG